MKLSAWETVAVDIVGPLLECRAGEMRHVLSMMDLATLWVELAPLSSIPAEEVSDTFFDAWLCRYPRPRVVLSDNGTQFTSSLWRELLIQHGIRQALTAPYNPTGNSHIERMHATMLGALRSVWTPASSLDTVLQQVAWSLRASFHSRIGQAPAQAVFGRHLVFPYNQLPAPASSVSTASQQEDTSPGLIPKEGDSVFIRCMQQSKLQDRYSGPFRVIGSNPASNTCLVDVARNLTRAGFRRLKLFAEGER